MKAKLVPEMRKIMVSPGKLILDPNNPRLISRMDDRVPDESILDMGIIESTRDKMNGGVYRIEELQNSIKTNGWQPVDSIFVRKAGSQEMYIVLEGNRRVTAIRNLLADDKIDQRLKNELSDIEVMEIVDEQLSPQEIEAKISYLLGVRHHGSLIQWSPFAQSHNIYVEYTSLANQGDENFVWNEQAGEKIADALSIELERVKDRLKVYRGMRQIGNNPAIKASEKEHGGMKDRYFSVCHEVLVNKPGKLKEYIKQDPDTFAIDEESLARMDNLCHFSTENRKDAPINNPQQWRYLNQILSEEDAERRKEMLREVELDKRKPDLVWSRRAEELRRLRWDKWLEKVALVLSGVTMANIQLGDDEKDAVEGLVSLLDELELVDANCGGTNA